MPRLVAIDSGPLVGLFSRNDVNHAAAIRFFRDFDDHGFVTVPIVTEVMHLLDFRTEAQLDFLKWLRRGPLSIVDLNDRDWDRIAVLIQKYSDRGMDLGDASLVAVCERRVTQRIATVDFDFEIYRLGNRKPFENVFHVYRLLK